MGTYTANYNLYLPTVGEQGWGDLMNGNLTTIDTTMKSLNNRITAVENEVNGALSCTSVTASGKITGNGGIAGTTGTFSGTVTAASFKPSAKTVVNVSPSSVWVHNSTGSNFTEMNFTILPRNPLYVYSGSITVQMMNYNARCLVIEYEDKSEFYSVNNTEVKTYTFTNAVSITFYCNKVSYSSTADTSNVYMIPTLTI